MPTAKLYVGDCVDVMKALPEASVSHACFSPPYDALKTYQNGQTIDLEHFVRLSAELFRTLKPGAVAGMVVNDAIVNGDRTCSSLRYVLAMKDAGFICHDLIPWVRSSTPYTTRGRLAQCWELCAVMSKGKPAYVDLPRKPNVRASAVLKRKDGSRYTVKAEGVARNVITDIDCGRHKTQTGKIYPHPAPYPPALAARFIKSWCPPGGVVLDFFTGISSTGVGVAQAGEGRSFVGVDLSRQYISWSRERLAATGYFSAVEIEDPAPTPTLTPTATPSPKVIGNLLDKPRVQGYGRPSKTA